VGEHRAVEKSKKPKIPNELLRHEREKRGWSQNRVAELIEADTSMISRWECGERRPEPLYQEKLCNLFGKNAEELGFIKRVYLPSNYQIDHTTPAANNINQSNKENVLNVSPYFSFGDIETTWVVIDGDGLEEYKPENIHCHFNPEPDRLPEDLAARREQIQKQQEENRSQGKPFQWNGERYSLDSIILSRSPTEEDMTLDLWFKPSDYYTFLATNQSLRDRRIRERYLKDTDWQSPVRFFSNSFGVSLVIITTDNYTLFTQRGKNLGSRPSQFNISVSEGLSKVLDHKLYNQAPDIYNCASRGVTEELGLSEPDDFQRSNILLLSLGVDTLYSLWGLRGMVKVNRTIEEVIQNWKSGVKDKLENMQIHPVKFAPDEVIHFVLSHTPWAPSGLACIYHALVHEHGKGATGKAMKKYQQQHEN
jgi:transcriptional regulator with XRE-family HTH domain